MSIVSLELLRLKEAKDLAGVARVLGVKPPHLSYILYVLRSDEKYETFSIPKKRGGFRDISAPDDGLKDIQRRLADVLLRIEFEQEADYRKRGAVISHGFKTGLSIVTNATKHRNKRFVFNLDLQDFFPSINFGRVRGFFIGSKNFTLTPEASTVLAQIACHNNVLPQGSPCSPPISNLIANILDIRLNRLARECRCTYTRYADDITFSTNEQEFPSRIAISSGEAGKWQASEELVQRIAKAGFQINPNKTRMQHRRSRQDATGLVVNKKVNVPADFYKETRAMCDRLFWGNEAFRKDGSVPVPMNQHRVRGRLAHIYRIRRLSEPAVSGSGNGERRPAYERLYARFLNYASFWALPKPLIVCEGKTDNIYIRSAMKGLREKFPAFIEGGGDVERFTVNFFKYGKLSKAVQDLSGGSGQLKNLAYQYEDRTDGFRADPKHPVIIVSDADKAAEKLFEACKKKSKHKLTGSEKWFYLGRNLYVVPIPHTVGLHSEIEDLFQDDLLARKIGEKIFDRSNKEEDGETFYSKYTFATQIVAPEVETINFERFEGLLQAIMDVMDDYSKLLSAAPASESAAA